MNVDVLSDMILHDLLCDTVDELQSHEQQEADYSEAVTMQDAPSLETMYQRLAQMEASGTIIAVRDMQPWELS